MDYTMGVLPPMVDDEGLREVEAILRWHLEDRGKSVMACRFDAERSVLVADVEEVLGEG